MTNDELANYGNVTAIEMITTGMKAEFNLKRPKYGLKGYYMPEANLHEKLNYKIDSIAINKRDK